MRWYLMVLMLICFLSSCATMVRNTCYQACQNEGLPLFSAQWRPADTKGEKQTPETYTCTCAGGVVMTGTQMIGADSGYLQWIRNGAKKEMVAQPPVEGLAGNDPVKIEVAIPKLETGWNAQSAESLDQLTLALQAQAAELSGIKGATGTIAVCIVVQTVVVVVGLLYFAGQ